jgi:hypothetical protein
MYRQRSAADSKTGRETEQVVVRASSEHGSNEIVQFCNSYRLLPLLLWGAGPVNSYTWLKFGLEMSDPAHHSKSIIETRVTYLSICLTFAPIRDRRCRLLASISETGIYSAQDRLNTGNKDELFRAICRPNTTRYCSIPIQFNGIVSSIEAAKILMSFSKNFMIDHRQLVHRRI